MKIIKFKIKVFKICILIFNYKNYIIILVIVQYLKLNTIR